MTCHTNAATLGNIHRSLNSILNLLVKQQAPCFEANAVVKGEIKKVALSSYKGKYVILVFYPLDL
jgi:hypothetical protein